MDTRITPALSVDKTAPDQSGVLGKTKTDVVVPVAGGVPVAVRRANVPRFVVPRAAPQHAPAAYWPDPLEKGIAEKIRRRSPCPDIVWGSRVIAQAAGRASAVLERKA
jgi:hypothetical protein